MGYYENVEQANKLSQLLLAQRQQQESEQRGLDAAAQKYGTNQTALDAINAREGRGGLLHTLTGGLIGRPKLTSNSLQGMIEQKPLAYDEAKIAAMPEAERVSYLTDLSKNIRSVARDVARGMTTWDRAEEEQSKAAQMQKMDNSEFKATLLNQFQTELGKAGADNNKRLQVVERYRTRLQAADKYFNTNDAQGFNPMMYLAKERRVGSAGKDFLVDGILITGARNENEAYRMAKLRRAEDKKNDPDLPDLGPQTGTKITLANKQGIRDIPLKEEIVRDELGKADLDAMIQDAYNWSNDEKKISETDEMAAKRGYFRVGNSEKYMKAKSKSEASAWYRKKYGVDLPSASANNKPANKPEVSADVARAVDKIWGRKN
jgi:hypothetical protein